MMIPDPWLRTVLLQRFAFVGPHTIGLVVTKAPDGWIAAAIETSAAAGSEKHATSLQRVNAVFDDHAHHVIGLFSTEFAAKSACIRFLGVLRGKARRTARCGCGPLQLGELRRRRAAPMNR
jgi:hypothetical protein